MVRTAGPLELMFERLMHIRARWLTFASIALVVLSVISTRALDNQMLPGHVPAAVARVQPVDGLAATNYRDLAIGLPLRNQAKLSDQLRQLYDPASANFHRYLSPKEFTDAFGPNEDDYQAAIQFANDHGLTVTRTHSN